MFEGEQAASSKADTSRAIELYIAGMTKYENLLNEYKDLRDEGEMVDEGLIALFGWRQALELEDKEIPEEYPLKEMWESQRGRHDYARDEFNRRRKAARWAKRRVARPFQPESNAASTRTSA